MIIYLIVTVAILSLLPCLHHVAVFFTTRNAQKVYAEQREAYAVKVAQQADNDAALRQYMRDCFKR